MAKKKHSFAVLLFICAALVVFNINFYGKQYQKSKQLNVITWDAFGYYIYLPATFIYHDIAFKDKRWLNEINNRYNCTPYFYQLAGGSKGKSRIIYQQGLSYFYLPGFLIAHTVAKLVGFNADGFSLPYQLALIITSLFTTFLGLFYLRKISLCYFTDGVTATVLILICLGTNWFLTVGYGHGMPHNFLFTLAILILYCTKKWFEFGSKKHAILTAVFIAWAFSCRPTALIFMLIPLLWNVRNFDGLKAKLKAGIQTTTTTNTRYFIAAFIISLLPLFGYMQYASNDILKFNLHTEKLCLLAPYTFDFLFSYKKGWLLYTPIMVFSLIGFYPLFKINKSLFVPIALVFILQVWLASSWENWWYAASYSQRTMVDCYGLLAIPLGFFLTAITAQKKALLVVVITLVFSVFGLSIFQSYQYYIGIIHNERMTKNYYKAVFGKLTVSPEVFQLLEPDRSATDFINDHNYFQEKLLTNFEDVKNSNDNLIANYNSKTCLKLDAVNSKLICFDEVHKQVTNKKYFWIVGQVEVQLAHSNDRQNLQLVVKTDAFKNRTIKGVDFYSDTITAKGSMLKINFKYITPNFFHDNDEIKVELIYHGKAVVYLSNLKISALIPAKDY